MEDSDLGDIAHYRHDHKEEFDHIDFRKNEEEAKGQILDSLSSRRNKNNGWAQLCILSGSIC